MNTGEDTLEALVIEVLLDVDVVVKAQRRCKAHKKKNSQIMLDMDIKAQALQRSQIIQTYHAKFVSKTLGMRKENVTYNC